jgi:uncharacterized repeat protein (TIGR03803 family)
MRTFPIASRATVLATAFVFAISAVAAARETVVYSFCKKQNCADGDEPETGLMSLNGLLYGTTNGGGAYDEGVAFSLDPATGDEKLLHSFGNGPDGYEPASGLINVNGALYGATSAGGAYGYGTVYAIDLATGNETVVYSFCPQQSCRDGQNPFGGLISVKGILYGTTADGGSRGDGTVFSINPTTGAETVVHSFDSFDDGAFPRGDLIHVKGRFYGTTSQGGAYDRGIVYSIMLADGVETILHSFGNGKDASTPLAGLIDVNGILYGTTNLGGSHGGGAVYSVDPATGTEAVLYSFCSQQNCTDGQKPQAGLILLKGTLYGMTFWGGSYNEGTVFSVDAATGAETVLHSFCTRQSCRDGAYPYAGLMKLKRKLYGTTFSGGAHGGGGALFELKP